MAGQGLGGDGACCWSLQEAKRMKENEREGDAYIYIKGGNIIIITHHHFPPKSVAFARSQGCV